MPSRSSASTVDVPSDHPDTTTGSDGQFTGRFRANRRGFGFLADTDGTSVFVPPPLARQLVDGDEVTGPAVAEPGRDGGGRLDRIDRVVRHRRLLVGVVDPGGRTLTAHPQLTSATVTLPHRMRQAAGQLTVVTIAHGPSGPAAPVATGIEAGPVPTGSPQAAQLTALVVAFGATTPAAVDPDLAARLGIDTADSQAHRRLAAALAGRRDLPAGRTRAPLPAATAPADVPRDDRTGLFTVTIDGPSSRDLDDALSARWDGTDGPVTVDVHIADVAQAVPAGSRLDRRALLLATSSYLDGLVCPMLPADLSEDALSLLPGQDRDTLTVRFDVQADGTVTDVDVSATSVVSDRRLDYTQVQQHLDGGRRLDGPAGTTVDAAAEAARRLQQVRDGRPTLSVLFDHDRPEATVTADGSVQLVADGDADAHALIEALMVATNEQVAVWLADRDVPCLFRTHEGVQPDRAGMLDAVADTAGVSLDGYGPADITGALGRLAGPWADALVSATLSAMGRAVYGTAPSPHAGLGSTLYCHFTSPIRRYADLVVHRQVRAVLAGERPVSAGRLDDVATWVNVRAGAAARAEALEQTLLVGPLLAGSDEPVPAQVCRVVPAGVQVRLDGSGVPAFVPAGQFGRARRLSPATAGHATSDFAVHVGQRRAVRVDGVDPHGELQLTLA